MVTMVCWLVIHTSRDGLDNRRYEQFKGQVLKEYSNSNELNFAKDFSNKKVDVILNNPIRVVQDNDCLYVTKPST